MRERIFTIGHSNRSFEEFGRPLEAFEIRALADVRRYPSSRKFPHFNRDVLRGLLDERGVDYMWFEALGGRRHAGKEEKSPNTGLESPGFRAYADYMMAEGFRRAARELLWFAQGRPTAVMCAERFFWKCHRRLLSDFLTAQGVEVVHIVEAGRLSPHGLTPAAVVTEEGGVIYPPAP